MIEIIKKIWYLILHSNIIECIDSDGKIKTIVLGGDPVSTIIVEQDK